jgi:hypothetical protein
VTDVTNLLGAFCDFTNTPKHGQIIRLCCEDLRWLDGLRFVSIDVPYYLRFRSPGFWYHHVRCHVNRLVDLLQTHVRTHRRLTSLSRCCEAFGQTDKRPLHILKTKQSEQSVPLTTTRWLATNFESRFRAGVHKMRLAFEACSRARLQDGLAGRPPTVT